MARNKFSLTSSAAVALTAATEKTVVQLNAGAAICSVVAVDLTFDGTSNSAVPVVCKLITVSTAGTGSARNPLKLTDRATALIATGTENHSAEGTNANILKIMHIHPQAGVVYPFPITSEIEVPGSGRLAVKVTAPAGVNCLCTLVGEE